jgi:hypothetical protein
MLLVLTSRMVRMWSGWLTLLLVGLLTPKAGSHEPAPFQAGAAPAHAVETAIFSTSTAQYENPADENGQQAFACLEDDDVEKNIAAKRGLAASGAVNGGAVDGFCVNVPHQNDGTYLAPPPPLIYAFCTLLI